MARDHAGCIFCEILAGRMKSETIYRDEICAVILDAFPLTRGHLLVLPHQHAQHIEELPAATVAHIFATGARFSSLWLGAEDVSATNLMLNNGTAANQHVPHVHLHVIPRRRGDSLPLAWRFLTRFLNPLSMIGRNRRMARDAARIRAMLASRLP